MIAVSLANTTTLQDFLLIGILLQDFLVAGELEDRLVLRCRSIEEIVVAGWSAWVWLEPARRS